MKPFCLRAAVKASGSREELVGLGIPPCSCSGRASSVQCLWQQLWMLQAGFLQCERTAKPAVDEAVRGLNLCGFSRLLWVRKTAGRETARHFFLLPLPNPVCGAKSVLQGLHKQRQKNPTHASSSYLYYRVIISAITSSKVRTEKATPPPPPKVHLVWGNRANSTLHKVVSLKLSQIGVWKPICWSLMVCVKKVTVAVKKE